MSDTKAVGKDGGRHVVAQNRRARHEYHIDDVITAGIVLVGTEVKSLRAGKATLVDAYAKVEQGEMWLHNMHISPHLEGNRANVPPIRSRKLLLKRGQIDRLQGLTQQKGLALVPLSIIFERGFAKLELAVARGKKLYDKRESIKERDRDREARREVFGRG
ncbi:MAG: SsrA-binding protein SmpB [Armatimonadota bacterium]